VTRAGIWSAQSTELVSEGTLLATQLSEAHESASAGARRPSMGWPGAALDVFSYQLYIYDASMLVGDEYFPL
jgi:hypothetical protein